MISTYIQKWYLDIGTKVLFCNYKMYKQRFVFENYLRILPYGHCITFIRFRTLNNNLPVQQNRYGNTPREERLCPKCSQEDIGDEFYYLFKCTFFKKERRNSYQNSSWVIPYFRNCPFHNLYRSKI